MPVRAIIIALEQYEEGGVARLDPIPGVVDAARDFHAWLSNRKGIEPQNVTVCSTDANGWPAGTVLGATTGVGIAQAVTDFATAARDNTEELFVYYGGHGIAEAGAIEARDLIVGTDYVPGRAGSACIDIQMLQVKLWSALGPGQHFHFIDACRNTLPPGFEPGRVPINLPPSQLGRGTRYAIYSAPPGQVTPVDAAFSRTLMTGLNGAGRAKGWRGGTLAVTVDLLCEYITHTLAPREIDSEKKGTGTGIICAVEPVPDNQCVITVNGAGPTHQFVVEVTSTGISNVRQFTGSRHVITLKPNDYQILVKSSDGPLPRIAPPGSGLVDLFDNADVRFEAPVAPPLAESAPAESPFAAAPEEAAPEAVGDDMGRDAGSARGFDATAGDDVAVDGIDGATMEVATAVDAEPRFELRDTVTLGFGEALPPSAPAPAEPQAPEFNARLRVEVDPHSHVTVEHLTSGQRWEHDGTFDEMVPAGHYRIRRRRRRATFEVKDISVEPGVDCRIALGKSAGSSPAIERLVQHYGGAVAPIASHLGDPLEWELDFWLLALAAFDLIEHRAGVAPLHMLGGAIPDPGIHLLADCSGGLSVRVDDDAWTDSRDVFAAGDGRTLRGMQLNLPAGTHYLHLHHDGALPFTVATHAAHDRATLVTITASETARPRLHMYMLPLPRAANMYPPIGEREARPYESLESAYLAQTQFGRGKSARETLEGDALEVLPMKWVEPVASLMGAYELCRLDPQGHRAALEEVASNLVWYFDDIPDAHAIATLVGSNVVAHRPSGSPIILDGLLAYDDDAEKAFLPGALRPDRLDLSGPWTMWRGAIDGDPSRKPPAARDT